MNEEELSLFVHDYFASYGSDPLSIPLILAGELVHGAIAYAHGLGFEPAKDFEAARQFLPSPNEDCSIEFGREGNPLFIQGPNDNPGRVMRTLEQTVGRDNFNFSVVAPAMHRLGTA